MKAKEVFGLILRVFGVVGVAYCIRSIVKHPSDCTLLLVMRILFAVIGVYMVRAAGFEPATPSV